MLAPPEKKEQIGDLSLFTYFTGESSGSALALVSDHPNQSAAGLKRYLTPAETAEGLKKTSPAAHRAWLLGRLAAKAAARRRWGFELSETEVVSAADGRPLLHAGGDGELFVSISHTSGAAAALAGDWPVGIDLEDAERDFSERMFKWAFSETERALAPGAEDFGWPGPLALWCAKEAAAKSWGRALLNHFDQVRAVGADWAGGLLEVAWLGPGPKRRCPVHLRRNQRFLLALADDGRTANSP